MKIPPTLEFEQKLWNKGKNLIAGIDEVGRGCFAGPVVVAAVIFSKTDIVPNGIRDSKELTPKSRRILAKQIKQKATAVSIATIDVKYINKHGIKKATEKAMRKAVKNLSKTPDHLLIDAFYIPYIKKSIQLPIIKGDKKSISIAAASIVAKDYRDRLMRKYHKVFPEFGFFRHKGYGTKQHQQAILSYGITEIHRINFIQTFLFHKNN